MKRTGTENEWISMHGRIWRWDTDRLRLRRTWHGVMITGRLTDLRTLAELLRS